VSEAPSLHTTHSNVKHSNWLHKSESISRSSQRTLPLVVHKLTTKFFAFCTFIFSRKCYLTISWLSASKSSWRTFSINTHHLYHSPSCGWLCEWISHHLTEMATIVTGWWVLCEVRAYILTATVIVSSLLRFSPVSILPTMLHRHHLNSPLTRRTNGWSLGAFKISTLFRVSGCTVHVPRFLCCTFPTAHMPSHHLPYSPRLYLVSRLTLSALATAAGQLPRQ